MLLFVFTYVPMKIHKVSQQYGAKGDCNAVVDVSLGSIAPTIAVLYLYVIH